MSKLDGMVLVPIEATDEMCDAPGNWNVLKSGMRTIFRHMLNARPVKCKDAEAEIRRVMDAPQPATGDDLAIYESIADNYTKSITPPDAAAQIAALQAEVEGLRKDAELLDHLSENYFASEMNDFDKKLRPNVDTWQFFLPKDIGGSLRNRLRAAIASQSTPLDKQEAAE